MALKPKKCKLCGNIFVPNSSRQVYCKEQHYLPCPVCGKLVPVRYNGDKARTCSKTCMKQLMEQTNLERYGTVDGGNSDQAKEKRRQTNLHKYGVENPFQSEEFKEKSKQTSLDRYGVENASNSEVAREHRKQTNLKRYGVEHILQSSEFRISGMLKKYGVENPMQSQEIRRRVNQTNQDRYGVPWAISSNVVREKSNQTMLERYGSIDPSKVAEIREKTRKTCEIRYGVPYFLQSEEFQKAYKATMRERYGVDNPGQCPEIRERIEATNLAKYGVPYAFMTEEAHKNARNTMVQNMKAHISSYNKKYLELFRSIGISDVELEYYLEGRWFDFILPSQNILVEIDPTYTHSIEPNFYNPEGSFPKNYHKDKSELAVKHGFRCIHVFDWDDPEDICKLVCNKTTLYARKCEVDFISEESAKIFLDENHIQHSVNGQLVCIGLFNQGNLVAVMSFGLPRYNKKYQWELLRFSTDYRYRVVGGASKMFCYFLQQLDPTSIISYCNLAKFTGTVYEKLGMRRLRSNSPNRLWSKGSEVVTHMLLLQRGYDQLFGTNFGTGTDNEQLMRDHGWRTVYDCGQAVYAWDKT